ncbi:MAG: GNAT family N-acetyltransferase [Defluviitaleaceae bacterium]|nr:GNAT family N-acetyltransferase [Defluviitaleaceae bacterium]
MEKNHCSLADFQHSGSHTSLIPKFTEFETERFNFRKFNEGDFPILFEWHSSIENMGFRRDGVKSELDVRKYMKMIISEANADVCKNFWFAVVRKPDNRLVGEGILLDVLEKPELGWLVDKNYRGNGYGAKIGDALLQYSFQTLKLRRVIAACHVENHASYKLMEKIGMRREAHFKKEKLYGDEWCDRYQYAILYEEWERNHSE